MEGSSALLALRAAWPSPVFYRQGVETIWKVPRPKIVIWVWEREGKIQRSNHAKEKEAL